MFALGLDDRHVRTPELLGWSTGQPTSVDRRIHILTHRCDPALVDGAGYLCGIGEVRGEHSCALIEEPRRYSDTEDMCACVATGCLYRL